MSEGRTQAHVLVSTWTPTHWQFPVERERTGTRTLKAHDSYMNRVCVVAGGSANMQRAFNAARRNDA